MDAIIVKSSNLIQIEKLFIGQQRLKLPTTTNDDDVVDDVYVPGNQNALNKLFKKKQYKKCY